MQAVELQRGTRDSSLGVFQSSWIDTHEQSEQKTNAITCNISTGNSTLFLPEHGRGWKSGDASQTLRFVLLLEETLKRERMVLLINMKVN